MVAATIGSNHGSEISTNAFGSSAPAENTPRGRPRIGLRNGASIPFARIALAIVSPANAATSSPSNVNEIGMARSIADPPDAVRRPVTGCPRPEGSTARTRTSPCLERRRTTGGTRATWYQRSANAPLGLSRRNRKSAQASSLRASGSEGYAIPAWPP